MIEKNYPRSFSHIGIVVPDINKAVKFYQEVMGWYVNIPPSIVKEENRTAVGKMCIDIFGENWKEFEVAHLSTSDRIGVEIFSFKYMSNKQPKFSPFQTGLSHFCIQDPNIEDLVDKIVANGGKQRMPIRKFNPNKRPFKMVYVEDPFGIVFEIYTHSYELTFSAGAYLK